MNFTKITFRMGEFANDLSLNFPKIEHKFADQSSGELSLNFPKIEHKFADQSAGGELSLNFTKIEHKFADQSSGAELSLNFPKIEYKFADQSTGAVGQPTPEQSVVDLPHQALQHIVSAGALQHLPDLIAPTIVRDTGDLQIVLGNDGITDIFVFDADNLGSETDHVVNWDPGEDMFAIVNFTDDDVVGVTRDVRTGETFVNINGIDVAAVGVMPANDVFPMVATFDNDPFAFV